ncbi:uncharacterized protein LOC133524861 isoform X2 [Cydia pomonella]|uniref:uncharacterized protein LOC133524861 isoform X2 n=1 Tax=Cydia pomonella TaxID=82600 RepID=UPI002ADDA128|nr:uncharacterized protein LOC133524861 isoform X2 [Cydia pomonella]
MKSFKYLLICSILTLIIAGCDTEIIRESTSLNSNIIKANSKEGSSDKMNSSAYNYGRTRAVHAQRPNVAPIRPRHPTRSSDSSKSPAPATTSWREPKPSQPQRELIFTSPQRNMREKSGTAKDHSKKRHSRKRHHKNNSKRTQGLRNRRPNVFPMRPHFTTEKPTAVFRRRNPAFARSSQREHTFISVPRHIRTRPATVEDESIEGHPRRITS